MKESSYAPCFSVHILRCLGASGSLSYPQPAPECFSRIKLFFQSIFCETQMMFLVSYLLKLGVKMDEVCAKFLGGVTPGEIDTGLVTQNPTLPWHTGCDWREPRTGSENTTHSKKLSTNILSAPLQGDLQCIHSFIHSNGLRGRQVWLGTALRQILARISHVLLQNCLICGDGLRAMWVHCRNTLASPSVHAHDTMEKMVFERIILFAKFVGNTWTLLTIVVQDIARKNKNFPNIINWNSCIIIIIINYAVWHAWVILFYVSWVYST